MRKIDKLMLNAVQWCNNWQLSNTKVVYDYDVVRVYLHDKLIIEDHISAGKVILNNHGFATQTTAARLRAYCSYYLPHVKIQIKNGQMLANGQAFTKIEFNK